MHKVMHACSTSVPIISNPPALISPPLPEYYAAPTAVGYNGLILVYKVS